jgi:protoporphyrinogen oxidase
MTNRSAIIIGAGPAGLTAAYELLRRTNLRPIVLERSQYMGGISRTINYKGNRMDLGGHRFFSKSDRVMAWWLEHLPLENTQPKDAVTDGDRVMLLRKRISRIYFLRRFFNYPVQLTGSTLAKLGLVRSVRIALSYIRSTLFPIRPVVNLEQFFINRFGRELYNTFFKSYTEKVWGLPCTSISADWGQQRIKGLSVRKTIHHFLKHRLGGNNHNEIAQKQTETSLIEQFLYPKFGPGQMWEEVARKIVEMGGQIITDFEVTGLHVRNGRICSVSGTDREGKRGCFEGEYFFSTMPMQDLVRGLDGQVPAEVRQIADGLMYRDFITVGLLLNKLKINDENDTGGKLISDNWIYIQEPEVLAGRLQIFNNWSPSMVADRAKVWLGVEFFCTEGDGLWGRADQEIIRLAIEELHKIDIIDQADVVDSTLARMPRTYPAYFGSYARIGEVRNFLDGFENLFLIGRNGMHRYNNQDHSMLTAMVAVDNIVAGSTDKASIWAVNTEEEYHESKAAN